MRNFIAIFLTVLLAELGDKTQLATLLYTTDKTYQPLFVFAAAGTALLCSTAIAVFVGAALGRVIPGATIKLIAGIGFILMGIYTIATRYS